MSGQVPYHWEPERRDRWPVETPWVIYLLMLLSAPLLGAALAASAPQPAGECSGIGWGCTLYGWDRAGFMLLVLGLPYALVLGLVLLVLTSALPERHQALSTFVAAGGAAVPWLVGGGFILQSA